MRRPSSRLRILPEPTFDGPETLVVGGVHYGIPERTVTHLTRESRGHFAWILTPDRAVHAVTAAGEISFNPELQEVARRQLFGT